MSTGSSKPTIFPGTGKWSSAPAKNHVVDANKMVGWLAARLPAHQEN